MKLMTRAPGEEGVAIGLVAEEDSDEVTNRDGAIDADALEASTQSSEPLKADSQSLNPSVQQDKPDPPPQS